MNATFLADRGLKSYGDLKHACEIVKKERDQQFKDQPLLKKVGYYACEALRYLGLTIAAASLVGSIFFSTSYLLYGVAGAAAFLVGIVARKHFETLSPMENQLIDSVNKMNFTKDKPLNGYVLQYARGLFIDDIATCDGVAEAKKIVLDIQNKKQPTGKFATFFKFFGAMGSIEKWAAKKEPSAEDTAAFKSALVKRHQIQDIYVSSLLLESISHLASKRLDLVSKNVEAIKKVDLSFDDDFKAKITLFADKLKTPSKDLQIKVQKAFEKQQLKLSDLDRVYDMATKP